MEARANYLLLEADVATITFRSVAQASLNATRYIDAILGVMKGKTIFVSMVIAALLLFVVLSTSTPSHIGPVGVLFVFILIYILLLGGIMGLFQLASLISVRLATVIKPRRPVQRMSLTHSYYYASVLALVPVMLLAMQSVGEVDWRQLLLVVIFAIIACIYVKKRIG